VLTAISVLISLLLGEIVVRTFAPQADAMMWLVPDKRYGTSMRRNFHQTYHYRNRVHVMDVRINSSGLRGVDYSPAEQSDPALAKVLLLGDSFTFGHGVREEETFGALLEDRLNAGGRKFVVVNAGHGGWGTLQETRYGIDHLRVFRPSIVVLTFCGNDPSDDRGFLHGAKVVEKGADRFPGQSFLRDHSHLYRFLYKAVNRLRYWAALKEMRRAPAAAAGFDSQSGYVISETQWQRTLAAIRAFHEAYMRFNPGGLLIVQATAPWDARIRDHLRSLSDGSSLIHLDLYPETQGLPLQQKGIPYDPHWSPLIHAIAARKLHDAIIARHTGAPRVSARGDSPGGPADARAR